MGIRALACLSLVHWGRRAGHRVSDACQYLLGVLPNFAAAIAIPFVMLSIWADQNPHRTHAAARRSFLFLTLVVGTSLVAWEFMQMAGRTLVYDTSDILATLVGLGTGGVHFALVNPGPSATPG